ncbi:hypothetical protein GQ600_6572 [Phytophthora cactorum]|nr:hypothetical protein GQ600_6572 [Phytophthora cactorum]
MYNVQKELHEMREKIHRNETVENKSEKIKKIEDERDWYRKEALRLDAFTTTMTKDLKYMKENLESIEEDRNWLEKQLKACKKQNKLLRAELDVRLACLVTIPVRIRPGIEAPRSPDCSSSRGTWLASTELGRIICKSRTRKKFKKQIRSLKRELQHKSSELISIKRQQRLLRPDGGGTGQSPLEKFFLQCVDSVKEEVGRRRDCRPSSVKAGQRGSRSATEKPRQPRFDVELDDFTPNDRVRLIERLLAHDEVLSFLYNHLFPSEKPAVNTDALEMSWSSQPSGREFKKREESLPTLHSSVSLPDTTSLFSTSTVAATSPSKDGSDPIDATAEGTGAGPGFSAVPCHWTFSPSNT